MSEGVWGGKGVSEGVCEGVCVCVGECVESVWGVCGSE